MTLIFFILGVILYILISLYFGKYLYRNNVFNHKIFLIVYCIVLIMPIFSIIDYLKRFKFILLRVLSKLGYLSLTTYLYFILSFFLLFSIFALIKRVLKDNIFFKRTAIITISFISTLVINCCGSINLYNYQVQKIKIGHNENKIDAVIVSDIHYGTTGYEPILKDLVNLVNEQYPNYLFLVGDIIDWKIKEINRKYFVEMFSKINDDCQIYAVVGNHELNYNTLSEMKDFYSNTNITLLLDESIIINNSFNLIGRIDQNYQERLSLDKLIPSNNLKNIVLDHQPSSYHESIDNDVFLQISGHTHNGQVFPFNLAVHIKYVWLDKLPISSGFYENDNCHLLISSGFGAWGFPLRTAGVSEIIKVSLYY